MSGTHVAMHFETRGLLLAWGLALPFGGLVGCDNGSPSPSDSATSGDASTSDGSSSSTSEGSGTSGGSGPSTSSSGTSDETTTGDPTGADDSGGQESTGTESTAPAAYLQLCASCHGDDAKGTTLGPEIEHANPALAQWFVRNGDTNQFADQTTDPNEEQMYIGDLREMTAFDTSQLSDAELDEITTWLDELPSYTTGQELFSDHCEYCHGPAVPNRAFNPNDPNMRGLYYVKPQVSMVNTNWAEFSSVIRTGLNPDLDPGIRRRYMPGFSSSLLTDEELSLIAEWICGQYPDDLTLPADVYCDQIP